jgi:four helix bundle protein
MQNFRNLVVWQKAHRLRLDIHRETKRYPKDELFGLTGQTRRAAGSIGSNLAEGCGRGTDADFKRFVQMAMGSACEVENHLLVGRDLSYLEKDAHDKLEIEISDIKKMLSGLLKKLSQKADS